MDILLKVVSNKSPFLINFLKFFNVNIYFLKISSKKEMSFLKSSNSKNVKKLFYKLKSLNVKPLPIADEKNIPYEILDNIYVDSKNLLLKKVNSINSKKITKLFLKNISFNSEKIVKLLIKESICNDFTGINGYVDVWLKKKKKLVFITYNFKDLFLINKNKRLTVIYLPLDFFNLILKLLIQLKIIFKLLIFKILNIFQQHKKNKTVINKKHTVSLILHGDTFYGVSKNKIAYDKTLYYSTKYKDFKKENILHFGYQLEKLKNKSIKYKYLSDNHLTLRDIRSTFFFILKSILHIRNFSDLFLILALTINLKYFFNCRNIIKQHKELKIALIDYENLCPKIIILAFMSLNIKTVGTQERLASCFTNVVDSMVDDYFTASEKINKVIKNKKLLFIKNLIPVGMYRADKLSKKIKKKNSKNIIIALGFHTQPTLHKSQTSFLLNWKASKLFLEEMYRLSQDIKNCKIIIRYKYFDGYENPYFKEIIEKINRRKNIEINTNNETEYSYKLCSNADLVIAKHNSLADECISRNIPVIFYDYTHNLDRIIKGAFDYDGSEILCKNYSEILKNAKKFLDFKNNDLKNQFQNIKNKYYLYDKKKTVKDKILNHLNNYLIKQKYKKILRSILK